MNRDDISHVVSRTLDILEHEYGIEELESFGTPTVEEITDKIEKESNGL